MPEALNRLTAFGITILLKNVPRHWRDKSREEPEGTVTIYGICRKEHEEEVKERVLGWAIGKGPDVRDSTQLTSTLRPFDEWDSRKVGWLELDNGFMFFADEEMWRQTCELFGVETF